MRKRLHPSITVLLVVLACTAGFATRSSSGEVVSRASKQTESQAEANRTESSEPRVTRMEAMQYLLRTRDIAGAIGLYDSIAAAEPNNPWVYFDRGFAYQLTGTRWHRAASDYRRFLELEPIGPMATQATLKLQLIDEVAKGKMTPQDYRSLHYMEMVLRARDSLSKGDYAHASSACQVAMLIDPSRFEAYYITGQAFAKLGAWNEALYCVRQSALLAPAAERPAIERFLASLTAKKSPSP